MTEQAPEGGRVLTSLFTTQAAAEKLARKIEKQHKQYLVRVGAKRGPITPSRFTTEHYKQNPGMFGPEAKASAKQVTRIRPVIEKATGATGEIIGTAPGGFVKVKWDNRKSPSLIKRSQLKRGNLFEHIGRVTAKRNPSPYEDAVNIIEKEIRRVIREDKRHGTVGSSRASIKQQIRPRGLTIPPGYPYNQAFNEAFDRVEKTLKGYRLFNPSGGFGKLVATVAPYKHEMAKPGEYAVKVYRIRGGKRYFSAGTVHKDEAAALAYLAKKGIALENPSVTAIAREFQGKASGAVAQFKAANSAPSNLARAGRLVFLKAAGRTYRIPGAMVAIAPNKRLWVVGDHAPLFQTKAKRGQGLDVGELTHICYETAKAHVGGGKRYEYVHEFGEDGGRRPRLIIDSEGMPIIRGGDYKIKAEGIID